MNLIFEQIENREQCGSETVIKGFKVRCLSSTSGIVTIPTGLHYFDGRLDFSRSMLRTTIPICKNHEKRLRSSFDELSGKNAVTL